jgi:choice-of-anchor B domain-containing protein
MKKTFTFLFSLFISLVMVGQVNLTNIYNWKDSTLMGSQAFNNTYNEVWGFTQNQKEYAVIGTTEGTHIFDVSDPNNIPLVDFTEGRFRGRYVIHRDYHDYNGYLYVVCDEGPSSLQILDLSHLPDSTALVYDEDSLFQRSHNIFIDSARGVLYSCGGDRQLTLFSLADPTHPKRLLDCQTDVPFWNSIGYIHDIYVEDGIAFCNAGTNGFFMIDFTDPSNAKLMGSLTQYPDQGYNHSGWLHSAGNIYAMADETWGMDIKILDISDPSDIKVLSQINSNVDSKSIVHNLIFKGDLLFVSYYYDGVYVFDLSDPANPTTLAMYETSPLSPRNSYEGCWGVYPFLPSGLVLASDMQEGLFVFDGNSVPTSNITISEDQNFYIYPNPTSNTLNISNASEIKQIEIYNAAGSLLEKRNVNSNFIELEIENYIPKGVFIIKLFGDNFATTKMMMKI